MLGLYLSKEQGSRKFVWKQGPIKEFLWNSQVLIILIGNTAGSTDWNQVYEVIPTVIFLYVPNNSLAHTYTLSLAKNFRLSKIIYGTK